MKKVTKINLRINSKCHAHLQSLKKTPVKFQKDWDKIVGGTKTPVKFQKYYDKIIGGVALTRYLMSISFSNS